MLVSYKQYLTWHLYEPILHFTMTFIYCRALNSYVYYLGPGVLYEPCLYLDQYDMSMLLYLVITIAKGVAVTEVLSYKMAASLDRHKVLGRGSYSIMKLIWE